jgi:hypothetical protein
MENTAEDTREVPLEPMDGTQENDIQEIVTQDPAQVCSPSLFVCCEQS